MAVIRNPSRPRQKRSAPCPCNPVLAPLQGRSADKATTGEGSTEHRSGRAVPARASLGNAGPHKALAV